MHAASTPTQSDTPHGETRRRKPRVERERTPVPRMAVSITEACTALSLTRPTIYKLIADGRLRTVMVGTRRLIPVTELEKLLAPEK